jgi:hypothetical protein
MCHGIAMIIYSRHNNNDMKQITTQPVVTFQVGDRVQFNRSINDRGMNVYLNTEYGIIIKMNKVTAIVKTQTAAWKIDVDELTQYVDPFSGWAY